MSIRRVQTERVMQDVVHHLYSQGVQPTLADVLRRIAQYFSKHPAGTPLQVPTREFIEGDTSDVETYNRALRHMAVNLDVLYEAALDQVQDVLLLTDAMQSHLDRLNAYRRRIETTIDDHLLSLYNTDGYYFSISDTFSDATMTDLALTSAQIDTRMGLVLLPTISTGTKRLPNELIGSVNVNVNTGTYRELAPFSGALEDSLTNIVWAFEVETTTPSEVICDVDITIGNTQEPVVLSRIDLTPYGNVPVQVWIDSMDIISDNPNTTVIESGLERVDFGGGIQTSINKMTFGNDAHRVTGVRISFRKTQPDYTDTSSGTVRYRYIFGAKDITFLHQAYDLEATFVSNPLYLPEDIVGDVVIDAVSLVVDEEIPADGTMNYYVATTSAVETDLDEINWKPIVPISSGAVGDKIVRFNGATSKQVNIRETPTGSDLQLIPRRTTGPAATLNPSPHIIPAANTYRIAKFTDPYLANSLSLLEGVNTVRIYSRAYSVDAMDGLEWWSNRLTSSTVNYSRIDVGNEFFYGGILGESGRSVYVETYLDSPQVRQTFLADIQKSDPNSRLWDMKVFLNGRELGTLPAGVEKASIPWAFKQGVNHVALIINIPPPQVGFPNPYIGAVTLMSGTDLWRYGQVRLDSWGFIDLFTMQYSEDGRNPTYTIHNDEIITRKKPTTNFQLSYASPTGNAPAAVRFRADLSRSHNNPAVSPKLRSYRLRYSYSPDDI